MNTVENTSVEVLSFDHLVNNIKVVQTVLLSQVAHAVNLSLTVRNWMIGCYIVEYEQNGSDRAQYGDALLKRLAARINMRGLGERRLYEFRQMYLTYPVLEKEVIAYLFQNKDEQNLRLLTAKFGGSLPTQTEFCGCQPQFPCNQKNWKSGKRLRKDSFIIFLQHT